MENELLEIDIGNHSLVSGKMLAPKTALVVDPRLTLKVSVGDVIRLSHNPGEADGTPAMTEIVHKVNPEVAEIEFWSRDARDRAIALAAVLGGEVLSIEDIDGRLDRFSGTIKIAHKEGIDLEAIADAAGVTRMDDLDEEEDDDEDDDIKDTSETAKDEPADNPKDSGTQQ